MHVWRFPAVFCASGLAPCQWRGDWRKGRRERGSGRVRVCLVPWLPAYDAAPLSSTSLANCFNQSAVRNKLLGRAVPDAARLR
eukprot:2933983-Pleurochrysis_carterae.AAC.2